MRDQRWRFQLGERGQREAQVEAHRIVESEGVYKAIESKPLCIAGIYPKASLTEGCPAAS